MTKNIFLFFIFVNFGLLLFVVAFNKNIPFSSQNYIINAHHYMVDPRINGGNFNLLNALGQFDAQWYLKIAQDGYPQKPHNFDMNNKKIMDGLSYAFFPFYPLVIHIINLIISNLQLSAFLGSNLIMLLSFLSLFFLVAKLFTQQLALKTTLLVFFYPLSIFFRSYFSEGLFILLLIWFCYFFIQKKWVISGFLLGLLSVTRASGLFLWPLFLLYLFWGYKDHSTKLKDIFKSLVCLFLPFSLWLIYCFYQTGDSLIFYRVRSNWFQEFPLYFTSLKVANFFNLPVHAFRYSQIDIGTLLIFGFLLYISWRKLPTKLWWISFLLWVGPTLTTDTMSFSRYQIVSFPMFIFIAKYLNWWNFLTLLALFIIGLFWVSLYFVNWYWIG